jgi:hypothetical protein
MSDLAQSTVAFLEAMRLEEGERDVYEFATAKEADSFRVALYAVKRKFRDNTVLISISNTTISLTRMSSVIKRTRYAADGAEVEIPQESALQKSQYQLQVEEIVKDSEDFPENLRPDYIRDAIGKINFPTRRIA